MNPSPASSPLRVFVGFGEVAGYYSKIVEGLLDLGHSVSLGIVSDPFRYGTDDTRLTALPRPVASLFRTSIARPGTIGRMFGVLGRALLFAWCCVRCDVFIFTSGGSFFRGLDLPILRLLGKRTIAVYNGSDARPPYLGGLAWVGDSIPSLESLHAQTIAMRRAVRRTERFAGAVISHPAFSHFLSKPFYSYLAVGVPVPALPEPTKSSDVPVILHAPTRPLHKGTAAIEAVLEQLESEGVRFRRRVLMGLPNREVLDALLTSDLVVDEVYGDTLLGGLGAEAAAAGCAVVVTGYAGQVLAETHSVPLPPIELGPPSTLEAAVRAMVTDPEACRAHGRALREFVTSQWMPSMVAGRFLAIAEGSAPASWMIDPMSATYCEGWGVEREVLRRGLRRYIDAFGPEGLCLDHHPAAVEAFRHFIDEPD